MTDQQNLPSKAPADEIVPAEKPQPKTLMRSAKDFWENTFGKSTDLGGAVESFTSEMTLVIEGLSEDQTRISDRLDKAEARQTEDEAARREEIKSLREQLRTGERNLKQLQDRLQDTEKQTKQLQETLQKTTKEKADKKGGVLAVLRQTTVIAGILAGAWIIVTILNKFW